MGVGAAVIMTVPLAVLPSLFAPDERPKAVATITVALGLGLPLGPIVGGWLLGHLWWGSVFLINVPLGVAAAVGVALLLPDTREASPAPVDVVGAVLSTAGLVAVVYAVVEAPGQGWSSAPVLSAGGAGVVLLAAFVRWERRTAAPMVDLSLLSRPRFTWGTVSATVAMFAMLGLLFVVPLYLQSVRGFDPLGTGLRLLPLILGLVVGAKVGERLTIGPGARIPVVAGLLLIAAALLVKSMSGHLKKLPRSFDPDDQLPEIPDTPAELLEPREPGQDLLDQLRRAPRAIEPPRGGDGRPDRPPAEA
jgi:MFS family permease